LPWLPKVACRGDLKLAELVSTPKDYIPPPIIYPGNAMDKSQHPRVLFFLGANMITYEWTSMRHVPLPVQ
jgi:hypothetical protein